MIRLPFVRRTPEIEMFLEGRKSYEEKKKDTSKAVKRAGLPESFEVGDCSSVPWKTHWYFHYDCHTHGLRRHMAQQNYTPCPQHPNTPPCPECGEAMWPAS